MVQVRGELDLVTAPQLKVVIDGVPLIDSDNLVLDLTDVSFLDSSGLAVLCSAARRLARHGGRLVVRGLNDQCLRTVELVGLDAVVDLEP